MSSDFKAAAVFAGIGGFCLGFEEAGIKTVWAIENDKEATLTYSKNLKEVNLVKRNSLPADINDVSVAKNDLEPVDILHAGFPCQSFSTAGEQTGFKDPRGKLFYELIRIIKEFKDRKPSVIVFENTPNLRGGGGGAWFLEITKEIKKAGYWFRESNSAVLDTYELTNFPQQRKRLFMVAFSINKFMNGNIEFPIKKNRSKKDLSKFIDFAGSIDDERYYLSKENRYYKMINKEADSKDCIYQLRKYLVRTKEPGVCPTLTANMGLGGHNVPFIFDSKGLRKLTEYECLRLQGFPKSFSFPDEVIKYKRYLQVGNAVSVPIAKLVANKVKEKMIKDLY